MIEHTYKLDPPVPVRQVDAVADKLAADATIDELMVALGAEPHPPQDSVTLDLTRIETPPWLSKGEVVGLGIGRAKQYEREEVVRLQGIADLTIDLWIQIGMACEEALGEEE